MTSDNPDGGAAVAARIRRLSAGGAGTMTPAEILNSILTSVGVGTATGGPLRRRSTSSPEAGNSNSLSTASEVYNNQNQLFPKVNQAEASALHANSLAAETRQKGSKGNFIVSGDDMPKYNSNENLFYLIFPLIARKYGIQIHYAELKARQ